MARSALAGVIRFWSARVRHAATLLPTTARPLTPPALIFPFVLCALSLQAQSPQLKQAGVCSRCHVAQVLEWSVAAKHVTVGATCQSCHGPSAAHVANERNQIKPDRPVPTCETCHAQGCPKTQKNADCQSCHHPHALSNPNDRQLRQSAAAPDPAIEAYKTKMAEGDRLAAIRDWANARAAYRAAKVARPNDRRATSRLQMSDRLHVC